ncbi:zinc-dependent metalloprotease family protein [Spartinivicinus ruber]|uniref:zinc-dependent metalloprotease family protein n=1 Tax=Spartinivicinus ruber TaxID=2683272 RepID=UPI0013D0368B|nr:zinc-dependent metalloprotease family protein [Spartinivicinus ruber]
MLYDFDVKLKKIACYKLVVILGLFSQEGVAATNQVDIMVAYSQEAKAYYEKYNLTPCIEAKKHIDYSNDVLNNSRVNLEFKLVDCHFIDLSISEVSEPFLYQLIGNRQLQQLRSKLNADIVVTLTASDDTKNYGLASYDYHAGLRKIINNNKLKEKTKFSIKQSSQPFGLVQIDKWRQDQSRDIVIKNKNATDHTFTHEIGHLMGLSHDIKTTVNFSDNDGQDHLNDYMDYINKNSYTLPKNSIKVDGEGNRNFTNSNELLNEILTEQVRIYLTTDDEIIKEVEALRDQILVDALYILEYYAGKDGLMSYQDYVDKNVDDFWFNGIFDFSLGYAGEFNSIKYGTIMSYGDNIMPYFSSIDLLCSSDKIGLYDVKCGSATANASRSLNLVAAKVANLCQTRSVKSDSESMSLASNIINAHLIKPKKLLSEIDPESFSSDTPKSLEYNIFLSYLTMPDENGTDGIYPWNDNTQIIFDESDDGILAVNKIDSYAPIIGVEIGCGIQSSKIYKLAAKVKTKKPGISTLWLYYELANINPSTGELYKKWFKVAEKKTDDTGFITLEGDVKLPNNIKVATLVVTGEPGSELLINRMYVIERNN